MKRSLRTLSLAATLPLTLVPSFAQEQKTPNPPAQNPPAATTPAAKPGQRPYAEVVTKDAVTMDGLFKVHHIGEKVLFEIPTTAFGKEMLWKATTAASTGNITFPGDVTGTALVRLTRRGNRVLLRAADTNLRVNDPDEGWKENLTLNTLETIVGSLPVLTESEKGAVVVDATSLFLGNPADIGARRPTPGVAVDPNRSFIEKVKAFPTNIEIKSQQTIIGGSPNPFLGLPVGPPAATTQLVHYSLVALPEKPMMGRLADSRIGLFAVGYETVNPVSQGMDVNGYITRFRLEKKDPNAALSEPVQPITWYIAKEVPVKWRPWVKKGIEDWNVAFEAAGFKNAIRAVEAPNDGNFDPEDARYSVVRWSTRAVQNAYAGPIADPRSGETISAQMVVFQDILKLVQGWYFSQCGATDPRAARLPFPDDLQGELLRYVVAHEAGHALGMYHNWKASSHYSVQQLRDPKFTAENGVSASIMDYSRFNYVAQPGDGVKQLIGKIGPYDKFAIMWGYAPIPGAKSPEDEERTLDGWLGRQISDPRLRYWPEQDPVDPASQNEDIGNDPVAAGRLGMKNLDYIAKNILMTSTSKFGKDYSLLSDFRDRLLYQRTLETMHALKNVGGVVGNDYHAGRGGEVYSPVPKARQKECVSFVVNEALKPSPAIYSQAILNRVQPSGLVQNVSQMQSMILNSMFGETRLMRLTDQEAMKGASAYTVGNLVNDVTGYVWADLNGAAPKVDLVRRSLQRNYLRTMDAKVNATTPSQTDVKMNAIAALKGLVAKIDKAMVRTTDADTKMHLAASRRDIEKIMDGKFSAPTSTGAGQFGLNKFKVAPMTCSHGHGLPLLHPEKD